MPRLRCSPISVALTTQMQHQWQMTLLWGVCVGTGTGRDLDGAGGGRGHAMVRGAARAWCSGALSAANATGQLVFLPLLARVVEASGMAQRPR